ncbi:hypothetical protein DFO61_2341 [Ectopseudomonas oleovorans]|uniref:Uncharacterized protein n=1 Tax=Ectopseudomonas oleovorans TaxID=301 RepID=A0A397N8Z1_ECTOL|nr:hypothetical protein [Pseudomonas oleovorans]RIA31617.1 hypothetical protein DFO61_2341 [Pseudomonas oleovorans]
MEIVRSTFYRSQHVTGPACVLVSIRFGKKPENGPQIFCLLAQGKHDASVKFDLENHVAEVLSGVAKANAECSGALEVEAIEVVPDDYPRKTQAEYVAYKIATAVLQGEI